jgi:hypothetical protein
MIRAEALDRPDGEQAAAQPEAEEGNSRIARASASSAKLCSGGV